MIKTVSLKCPECGANLEIDDGRKQCFCQYCGNKIIIDDGSRTYTHIYVDKTREKELELEEKKLAIEEEKEKENTKWKKTALVSMVVSLILAIITFSTVKNDFNISFNFVLMLIFSVIAVARVMRKDSMLGLVFISLVFGSGCIMFMVSQNDFSTTFLVTLLMSIVLNIAASSIRTIKK